MDIWMVLKLFSIGMILCSAAYADDRVYTKSEREFLDAVKDVPVSGRVEHPAVVEDITPPTPCEKQGTGVAGFGHEEVNICPDGASGIKDMQESSQGKVTRWKGNPQIGYYRLREDGSIDTSYWRQSIGGTAA